ncbi:MAG: ShlB/FhaC/HecB family hemolysin secretion/activation protein [Nitrosomonadales bacterium]|nr:ShlB/FhaC/HecB family hemolysin secretion/activation protein [Nitrosomonadales bacterium]
MSKRVFLIVAVAVQLFSAHPAMAEPVKFDISEFSVEGDTLLSLSDDEIQRTLAPFIGKGRDMADVNKAAEALRTLYHDAGYSIVQVIPPVQTITKGKVVLKVVEDKIISIDVKGNVAYDADNIRASLPPLQMGKSINANELEAAIALANENSAKQVAVNIRPGAQLGDINTRIDVTEDRISKFVATYDNTGSSATGFNKVGLTYQNANLFDRDHALALQYNGSADYLDKVYSFSLGYHIPFYGQGLSVDLIAAYSSSSGQNVNLYFSGKGTVFGARLNYALASMGDIRHKLIFGADYKDSQSIASLLVTPITEIPVSLTYYAQVARPEFQGNGSVAFVTNIRGGPHGATNDYYNQTTGLGARIPASGGASTIFPGTNWNILRINGSGGFALPEDWQARVAVNGQFTRDLLLPSEQFGAGGATASVRGYPERIISGDEGYTANFELYTPDLNKYMNMQESSLRALVFWDYGSVSLNDKPLLAGMSRRTNIDGLGLGCRSTFMKDFNLKLDVGWARKQVGSAPLTVYRGDAFGNIALSVTF